MDEPKTDATACFHCGNTDLSHGHDEYFCLDCCLHICPICGHGTDFGTVGPCEHYLACIVSGTDVEEEEWSALFSMEELGPDSSRDSEWQEEYAWAEGVWESATATIAAMSEQEKQQRFGPLYPILAAFGSDHVGETCALLDIPFCSAYTDGSPFFDIYYTELGSDKAWERLRPAIEKYRQGLAWLERHAREWA